MSVVVLSMVSRRKMSSWPLVSLIPSTKSVAFETNTTKRPSPLIDGWVEKSLPGTPLGVTLTHVVTPVATLRRKTSLALLVSLATRLVAADVKATRLPSALMAMLTSSPAGALPCTPLLSSLSRTTLVAAGCASTLASATGPAASTPASAAWAAASSRASRVAIWASMVVTRASARSLHAR